MTLEVSAAIAGAFDAGATDVLVSDSHGDAQNIDVELLDKRARLVRAWPRPLSMMQGIDETIGAVIFIGYHAGEEAKRLLGPIETVAVKQALGFHAATMLHPEEAQRLIREGVERGIDRRADLAPYKVDHPVELELTLTKTVNAELAAYLPGVKRLSGNTVLFTATDMTEASKFLEAVTGLNAY